MTITIYIKNLRQGRACPGHPRPAEILVGWLSSFFRILLANARLEPTRVGTDALATVIH
jgi:hypothetical protein